MNTTYLMGIIAQENQERASDLRAARELQEKDFCISCGKEITDYEDTEFTGSELIFTYRCPCGCYAEQHFSITYTGTKEIE